MGSFDNKYKILQNFETVIRLKNENFLFVFSLTKEFIRLDGALKASRYMPEFNKKCPVFGL